MAFITHHMDDYSATGSALQLIYQLRCATGNDVVAYYQLYHLRIVLMLQLQNSTKHVTNSSTGNPVNLKSNKIKPER